MISPRNPPKLGIRAIRKGSLKGARRRMAVPLSAQEAAGQRTSRVRQGRLARALRGRKGIGQQQRARRWQGALCQAFQGAAGAIGMARQHNGACAGEALRGGESRPHRSLPQGRRIAPDTGFGPGGTEGKGIAQHVPARRIQGLRKGLQHRMERSGASAVA